MSKLYNCRPSEVMKLDDEYTAFCFDEACALIMIQLQKGETPNYTTGKKKQKKVHYTNFKDLYKQYG